MVVTSVFFFSLNVFLPYPKQISSFEPPLTHSLKHTILRPSQIQRSCRRQLKLTIKGFLDTDCIENIVEKGEIAQNEQFHLFQQCFPKAFFFNVLK